MQNTKTWNPNVVQRIKHIVDPTSIKNVITIQTNEYLSQVFVFLNFECKSLIDGLKEIGFSCIEETNVRDGETCFYKKYIFALCHPRFKDVAAILYDDLQNGDYGFSPTSDIPLFLLTRESL